MIAAGRTCALAIVARTNGVTRLAADTRISRARVARDLDALARINGKPNCIVSDNGTEFTISAIPKWADANKVAWHYIDRGKPQQSGVTLHRGVILIPPHLPGEPAR